MRGTPEEVFNHANDLKWFYLKFFNLDDPSDYIEVDVEMVITIETKYERNNPVIRGVLTIKDLIDLHYHLDITKTGLEIYFQDFFDEFYLRRFHILNVKDFYMGKTKNIKIEFQDEISWKLQNTYISKSFKESKVSAFQKYIDYLEIPTLLEGSGLITDFETDSITDEFVVPRNVNLLEFFQFELRKIGYELYQDRKGLKIKKSTNLLPSKLESVDELFTDEAPNQMYQNKIFDCTILYNDKEKINSLPRIESNYYDFEQKKNLSFNNNDLSEETKINTDIFDMKETNGLKNIFQNRLDDSKFTTDIKNSFLQNSDIEILTNGYNSRSINTIIDVKFSGNITSVQGLTDGNRYISGKYLVNSIVDKLVGGKLIQKIGLIRSDYQNTKI